MSPTLTADELAELRELLSIRFDEVLDDLDPSDPDELERVALLAVLPLAGAHLEDEGIPAAAVAEAIEARGDERAAALLRATEMFGDPALARPAGEALERLRGQGIQPRLPEGLGELRVREARCCPLGVADLYLLTLERPGAAGVHACAAIVEHGSDGGVLVQGSFTERLDATEAPTELMLPPGAPPAEAIAVEAAAGALVAGADRARELGRALPFDFGAALPLVSRALTGDPRRIAAARLAPPGARLFVDPDDHDGFDSLVTGLLDELMEGAGEDGPVTRSGHFVGGTMLEWRWTHRDGDLGGWDEADLEEFLLHHIPRKVATAPEIVADAPACVIAVLELLDEHGMLSGAPVGVLGRRCQALRRRFAAAAGDRSRFSPAKALMTQMQAEGVELTDQASLDAWLEDFNSRPREQRDAVLGPALDAMGVADGPPPVRGARPSARSGAKRRQARVARKRNRR